jgi:hypothetical protein
MSNNYTYSVLSVEQVPAQILLNGTVTTAGILLAITPYITGTEQPSGWQTPVTVNGNLGLLIGPGTENVLPVGEYVMWYQATNSPEVVVSQCTQHFWVV